MLVRGDVRCLPLRDGTQDAVSLSFALRNLDDRPGDLQTFLKESFRVVRPGGRLLLLETSQPSHALMRAGFHLGTSLVTTLAGLFSTNREAYRYLSRSIKAFPDARGLLARCEKAGWQEEGRCTFWGGAVLGLLLVRPDDAGPGFASPGVKQG